MIKSREEMQIISKIVDCKNKLRKLDYYTNKWIEGKITETRWNEIVAERDKYRAEINALEAQLQVLREKKG